MVEEVKVEELYVVFFGNSMSSKFVHSYLMPLLSDFFLSSLL
jgi:hypothetical protein